LYSWNPLYGSIVLLFLWDIGENTSIYNALPNIEATEFTSSHTEYIRLDKAAGESISISYTLYDIAAPELVTASLGN